MKGGSMMYTASNRPPRRLLVNALGGTNLRSSPSSSSCSGISFDLQQTLYNFKGMQGVGKAYDDCAKRYVASLEEEEKQQQIKGGSPPSSPSPSPSPQLSLLASLPSPALIEERFAVRGAYKAVLKQRVGRYNTLCTIQQGAKGGGGEEVDAPPLHPVLAHIIRHRDALAMEDASSSSSSSIYYCTSSISALNTTITDAATPTNKGTIAQALTCCDAYNEAIDAYKRARLEAKEAIASLAEGEQQKQEGRSGGEPPSRGQQHSHPLAVTDDTIPFGGFTAKEVEEDWMGLLAYVFGGGGQESSGNNKGEGRAPPPSLPPSIVHGISLAVLGAFSTPQPYELLPNTRRTLLSLKFKYPHLPIAAVTNNDGRIVKVMDSMRLFEEEEDETEEGTVEASSSTAAPPSCSSDADAMSDAALAKAVFGPSIDLSTLVLGDLLDVIVTPSATGAAKPHPSTLFAAIRQCCSASLSPSVSAPAPSSIPPLIDASLPHAFKGWVHVGDHKADKEAARRLHDAAIIAQQQQQQEQEHDMDALLSSPSRRLCRYVECDPIRGPSLAAIEAAIAMKV